MVPQFTRLFLQQSPRERLRKQSVWRLELSLIMINSSAPLDISYFLLILWLQKHCEVIAKDPGVLISGVVFQCNF